jgi:hypothetical protein
MTQQPAAQRPTGWRGNKVKNPGDRMRYSPTREMKASALLELTGSARPSGNSPHLRSYHETTEAEWRQAERVREVEAARIAEKKRKRADAKRQRRVKAMLKEMDDICAVGVE